MQSGLEKYLERNPTRRECILANGGGDGVDTAVVVPVFAESQDLPNLTASLAGQHADDLAKTAFLFVVNNSPETEPWILEDNARSLAFLRETLNANTLPVMAVVDRCAPGRELPAKDAGVGLARKTGMDAALDLYGRQGNPPALVCLDADCVVSENYLTAIRKTFSRGARCAAVQYEHPAPADENAARAIICYELFLRAYFLGLHYIASPYAFHTIGSTIAVTAETYVKCGGMSKLKAGEDFYFLQKAAKIAPVHTINETRVYPSGRPSFRVPFGTGQRVRRFFQNGDQEYAFHAPESYRILKRWLAAFAEQETSSAAVLMAEARAIAPALAAYLDWQGFGDAWENIRQKSNRDWALQRKTWFDAFRQMKALHYLRDNGYPDAPMFDAIDELANAAGAGLAVRRAEQIPPLATQAEYLRALREISVRLSVSPVF